MVCAMMTRRFDYSYIFHSIGARINKKLHYFGRIFFNFIIFDFVPTPTDRRGVSVLGVSGIQLKAYRWVHSREVYAMGLFTLYGPL